MMEQLKRARKTLAENGWVGPTLEPWCRDSQNRPVHHHDEGVRTFSVSGALQLFGGLDHAWGYLGRLVSPALARLRDFEAGWPVERLFEVTAKNFRDWDRDLEWSTGEYEQLEEQWWKMQADASGEFLDFGGWLKRSERTATDVLRVFTTAALRARR